MASVLDSNIFQYLQNLKASNPQLAGAAPPPALPGLFGGLPGAPPPGTAVSVAIDKLPFRYQLTEADVRETFQRWGTLQSVQVISTGVRDIGVVRFSDPIDAADAVKQLNGFLCTFENGAQGVLLAVVGGPEQLNAMMPPPSIGPSGLGMAPPMPGAGPPPAGPAPGMPPPGAAPNGPPAVTPSAAGSKWIAKVYIKAAMLQPTFPVAQKIIGQDGANMDHLRQHFGCIVSLRGVGSGTIEPGSGQEQPEPMFLELGSESADNGKVALDMVKDLLQCVYDEHKTFCEQNGYPPTTPIEPEIVIKDTTGAMAA
mmetsp:Transcript_7361/g.16106  ORF Transcript_7361/g.16106 Transcript_7361/m.16106 type:complete len:312 (+) Transcript_7361:92-1027(+)